MAKKVKKSQVKHSPKKHGLADDHTFLIVVGGGLVVIMLILIAVAKITYISNKISQMDTNKMEVVADKNAITITDKLTPETLSVTEGTKVTWKNGDSVPHTVVSDTGIFESKELKTDESLSYTFTAAGAYLYSVNGLRGEVVVVPMEKSGY